MIKFLDLQKVTACHAEEIHEAVRQVVDSGWYLRGEQTRQFESEYAAFIGTRHCVGVGNGLDALTLIYRAYLELGMLHEGDEVLVPANTYIASILAITENRLRPVLVEPRWDTLEIDDALIEQHITERTRSLLLVHLYGRNAWTERIADVCRRHQLLLVEDNAQAQGCYSSKRQEARGKRQEVGSGERGRRTGSLGHAAGHSFYPGKNLGALGDCGAVTTDDDRLADVIRALGNYGSREKYVFDYLGRNTRMDEVHAAVLRVKLRYLDEENALRRKIGRRYEQEISQPLIELPMSLPDGENVYHLFPIFCKQRDELQQYLKERGIETLIHYPIPPHLQKCWRRTWGIYPVTERISREELSLPMSPVMTDEEVSTVIHSINKYVSTKI